jgi:HlyD family secretion protein
MGRTISSVFRIEVAVTEEELKKLKDAGSGPTLELRPGIPAEVVIPTRQRTALQYFLEPLTSAIWSSFREE